MTTDVLRSEDSGGKGRQTADPILRTDNRVSFINKKSMGEIEGGREGKRREQKIEQSKRREKR